MTDAARRAPASGPPARVDTSKPTKAAEPPGHGRNVLRLDGELAHVSFVGGHGRNCDNPAHIVGARNRAESNAAERAWLRATYPGLRPLEHALTKRGDRMLDAFSLRGPDGGVVYACFDITDTFGSW